MADLFHNIDDPEETLETAETQSKSFLFSLLQTMKTRRNKETVPDTDGEAAGFGTQDVPEKAPPPPPAVPEILLECRRDWRPEETDERPEAFLYDSSQPVTAEVLRCFTLVRHALEKRAGRRNRLTEPEPEDAAAIVALSADKLQAFGLLLPPLDGGQHITPESIRAELTRQGVVYGIAEGLPEKLAAEQAYCKLALLASGTPSVDGKDGWVEEVIPTTAGTPFVESDGASIDYKNLSWIVPVQAGDVICKLHYPTHGQEGTSVTGAKLPGKDGAKAVLPEGKNTGLNKENNALVAKVDGQIFYENGRYKVNQMLNIDGDVDLSTGNLNIIGNLRIKGNVREGFTVRATGDVNIDGMAEGASITAGRNIFVRNGMNGNGHGFMDAGGEIKCQYLENASARATGNIYASSIINSVAESDGEIIVTTGRGSIIGGSITACLRISAKTIGNKMNRAYNLTIDATPHFRAEKKRLTEACDQAGKEIEALQTQLDAHLEKSPETSESLLKMLQLKLAVARSKESNLQKDLDQLLQKEEKIQTGQIISETVYPIAQVTIGKTVRTLNEMSYHCRIYKSEGEIVVGSL